MVIYYLMIIFGIGLLFSGAIMYLWILAYQNPPPAYGPPAGAHGFVWSGLLFVAGIFLISFSIVKLYKLQRTPKNITTSEGSNEK
jgi:hypothetical protein